MVLFSWDGFLHLRRRANLLNYLTVSAISGQWKADWSRRCIFCHAWKDRPCNNFPMIQLLEKAVRLKSFLTLMLLVPLFWIIIKMLIDPFRANPLHYRWVRQCGPKGHKYCWKFLDGVYAMTGCLERSCKINTWNIFSHLSTEFQFQKN